MKSVGGCMSLPVALHTYLNIQPEGTAGSYNMS